MLYVHIYPHIYAIFKHSWADTICIFSRVESVAFKPKLVKQVYEKTNILIPLDINCVICFSLCFEAICSWNSEKSFKEVAILFEKRCFSLYGGGIKYKPKNGTIIIFGAFRERCPNSRNAYFFCYNLAPKIFSLKGRIMYIHLYRYLLIVLYCILLRNVLM